MTLRSFFFMRRHKRACRELQRLVNERAASYETRRYREHRAAALKYLRSAKAT